MPDYHVCISQFNVIMTAENTQEAFEKLLRAIETVADPDDVKATFHEIDLDWHGDIFEEGEI